MHQAHDVSEIWIYKSYVHEYLYVTNNYSPSIKVIIIYSSVEDYNFLDSVRGVFSCAKKIIVKILFDQKLLRIICEV